MKRPLLILLAALIAFLPACSLLTPQQRQSVRTILDDQYAAGSITQAQYDAATEALDNDEPIDWATLLGTVGTGIVLTLLGVRSNIPFIGRGKPTQKFGLPQSPVKPA